MMQLKLGRHQKTIIQILDEDITDNFWGLPVTMLSRKAAQKLEKEPGSYVTNSLKKNREILTSRWNASFSRCLRRLEHRGLITKRSRPTSGRTHFVILTKEGRECARELEGT